MRARPGSGDARAGLPPAVDPFEVDSLSTGLHRRSMRAGRIAVLGQAAQLALMLGSTAVLARLLTPRDFGLLAMAATLVEFAMTFRDFGLSTAMVQRATVTQAQVSALFWRNLRLAVVLAAVMAACAPLLSAFYGPSELTAIVLALTLGVAALAVSQLHLAVMRRQMRFGLITAIDLTGALAGVAVAIGVAVAGGGYWALVAQQLALAAVQAGGAWVGARWRPAAPGRSAPRDDAAVRAMVSFGRYASSSRVVTYLGNNADLVLVGRLFGSSPLGLYKRAFTLSVLPFKSLYSPLLNVSLASFSRLQGDPARYRLYVRASFGLLFALTLPATAFVVVMAEEVVLLLLGDQWAGSVVPLRILAVGAFFAGLGQVTKWIYLSEDRTRAQLGWTVVAAAVTVAAVAVGAVWGLTGVAAGYAVATGALAYPAVVVCLAGSPLRTSDWWAAVLRPAAAAVAAAGVVAVVAGTLDDPRASSLRLGLAAMLYATVYAAAWLAVPGGRGQLRAMRAAARPAREPIA